MSRLAKSLFLSYCLVLSLGALAQVIDGFYPADKFTVADGLPSNRIIHLVQDGERHLWIQSNYGLARYDGIHFTPFTSIDSSDSRQVIAMHVDELGNPWFVVDKLLDEKRIYQFNGKNFQFFCKFSYAKLNGER